MKRLLAVACALIAAGSVASAAPSARGLLFTEEGNPLSLVPGRSDGLAISSFSIGESAYSPSGKHWVITANGVSADGSSFPQVLMAGTWRGARVSAVQNEPLPGLGLAFDRNPDTLAVNDDGVFAFGMTILGASTLDRVMIARYRPATGVFETVARQNAPIPGLAQSVPGADDERFGSSLSVASVLRNGRVGFMAESTSGSLPTEQDEFLLIEGDPVRVIAQAGATVPQDQPGGAQHTLANLERRASFSESGRRHVLSGQLSSAGNPDVVAVNGAAALVERQPVDGLVGAVFAPTVRMFAGGAWTARGTSTAGERYLIVNGRLALVSGQFFPGLAELGLVDRIDSAALDSRGNLAVGWSNTAGDPFIVVLPRGQRPFVAVDRRTQLDVGGSPRGTLFYGGVLSTSLGLGLGDDGALYFATRARDRFDLNVADGLFVIGRRP